MINFEEANKLTKEYLELWYGVPDYILNEILRKIENSARYGNKEITHDYFLTKNSPGLPNYHDKILEQIIYKLKTLGFTVDKSEETNSTEKGINAFITLTIKWNPFLSINNNCKCPDCGSDLQLKLIKHNS